MANFEYKTVAGPVVISVKRPADRAAAVKNYEGLINSESIDGWEFYTTDVFQTSNPTGCFGMGAPEFVNFKMLIFRRERTAAA